MLVGEAGGHQGQDLALAGLHVTAAANVLAVDRVQQRVDVGRLAGANRLDCWDQAALADVLLGDEGIGGQAPAAGGHDRGLQAGQHDHPRIGLDLADLLDQGAAVALDHVVVHHDEQLPLGFPHQAEQLALVGGGPEEAIGCNAEGCKPKQIGKGPAPPGDHHLGRHQHRGDRALHAAEGIGLPLNRHGGVGPVHWAQDGW